MKTVETPAEQDLVRRSLGGDERAQHALYRRYAGAMFHTVLRMVGSREDAEDLTQEVFAKVFGRLASFRGESALGAWMKRIAVNAALNFLRTANRLRFSELENQHPGEPGDEPPVDEEAWAHDIRRVHHAILELPEGCRLVFNLFLLEGYRHQDIAQMLGISESTSKTQYMRAKRLLHERLTVDGKR